MAKGSVTVDERILNEAEHGFMEAYYHLWKKQIADLSNPKRGLKLLALRQRRPGEYYCRISWDHADIDDTMTLNTPGLTMAQRLKIITLEAQKTK